MNLAQVLQLLQIVIPALESGIGLFIHNPASQNKFQVVVGDVNTGLALAPVVAQAVENSAETTKVN